MQGDKKKIMNELYMYIYEHSEHLKAVILKDYQFLDD